MPLAPKAFDTLLALVRNHGQVLEKNDLMEMLWPDSDVEEGNLPQHISALRKALGESPNDRRYIVTIPGRGYRFAAEVEEYEGQDLVAEKHTRATIVIHEQQSELDEADGAPSPSFLLSGRFRAILGVVVILTVVILLVTGLWRSSEPAGQSPAASIKSLAVLPFRQMGAEGDEYLGLGVADSLITKLSNLRGIRVRPTSAVLKYSNQSIEPAEIGRELGVEAVLEGSIRRDGENVRVTVQLVRVDDGSPLWAEKFDDRFTGIFTIEDSISARVGESLLTKLAGEERKDLAKRYTENTEAYQFYLKGRHFLSRRTGTSLRQAIEWFQKAVAADPAFAHAWAGLADAYAILPAYSATPVSDAYAEARTAAGRALALDAGLGEAHAALGYIEWMEWRWDEAEHEFRRALELAPGYATAYHWYANFLSSRGRWDEALAALRRALELDPVSLPIHMAMGTVLYFDRRFDESIDFYSKASAMDPGYVGAHQNLTNPYLCQRRYEDALAEWETVSRLDPERLPADLVAELREGYASGAERGYWEAYLEGLRSRPTILYHDSDMPLACAQLGRIDEAFALIDEVLSKRDALAYQIPMDPLFDPLHSDPRWESVLERLGLR